MNTFLRMENAEKNEENNTTNPVNNPPPLSTHYSRIVYIYLRTHFNWKRFKKRVLSTILKTFLSKKVRPLFCVIFFKTLKKLRLLFSQVTSVCSMLYFSSIYIVLLLYTNLTEETQRDPLFTLSQKSDI